MPEITKFPIEYTIQEVPNRYIALNIKKEKGFI